jgi:hypothetical protein
LNYSDMIRRSFRSLKSGGLWGFAATTQAVRVVVLLAVLAATNAVGESGFLRAISAVYPGRPSTTAVAQLAYFGAVMLALVLSIPANLILEGGLTHLSDEVLSGRSAGTSDGWSVGLRQVGKVFVIQFVVGLIAFVAATVCAIPLVLAAVGGVALSAKSGTASSNPVPVIVGVCCGYLVFLVLLMLVALFTAAYGSLAIRYGIIGRRTAGDALGSAFKALRARKKNVFVFSLIQLGFGLVWGLVVGIVGFPIQLAMSAGQRATTLSHLLGAYAISGPLAIALMLPLAIFSYSMWTAFFRRMTGLDAAPAASYAPPGPAYPPHNGVYPPFPPSGPMMANTSMPTAPSEQAEPLPPQVGAETEQPGQGGGPVGGHDNPSEPA